MNLRSGRSWSDRKRSGVQTRRTLGCCATWALLVLATCPGSFVGMARGVDLLERQKDGRTTKLAGKVVAEAEDGGVLFLTPDGTLWPLQPEEVATRAKDEQPFRPLSRDEMIVRLKGELPAEFKVHTTANYIICYNTSHAYAQWCGALYERLYRGFRNYWEKRGIELTDPELPLVAIVFDGKSSYLKHVKPELGEAAASIVGFYSPMSNRVSMYDLTGVEELRSGPDRNRSTAHINQVLSQPAAGANVATIVHEATHQLAYNCGLQTRLADNPLWVSEGLAVYFETPDMKNSKGWGSIGALNRNRLIQFRNYLTKRPSDSLETLIRDDKRFREPSQILDAYAEAWALNYFLLKTRDEDFSAYLRSLADKSAMVYDTPTERLAEFRRYLGDDLGKLDAEFVRYMRKVAP